MLAVKRYRSSEHRQFHRDASYLEGRRVRKSREMRAMEQTLVGLFRMELAQAISAQTRTLVVTMITLFVAGMSLAFASARLG